MPMPKTPDQLPEVEQGQDPFDDGDEESRRIEENEAHSVCDRGGWADDGSNPLA